MKKNQIRNSQMKKNLVKHFILMILTLNIGQSNASSLDESLHEIKNFKFVAENLASSGMLDLSDYQYIKSYGFKHVINLIPGMQLKERRHVESLGLSYEQIPVDWQNPTLKDFKQFVGYMKSYGDDKTYIHCQLNWRASAFVYLYRVTQLGVDKAQAKKDMLAIWEPENQWQTFIETVLKAYNK